jgi:hypothetical protein
VVINKRLFECCGVNGKRFVGRWVTSYHWGRIPPLMESFCHSFQDMRKYDMAVVLMQVKHDSSNVKGVWWGVPVYLKRGGGGAGISKLMLRAATHIATYTARPVCYSFTFLPFSCSSVELTLKIKTINTLPQTVAIFLMYFRFPKYSYIFQYHQFLF